jgi:hypothetical protein
MVSIVVDAAPSKRPYAARDGYRVRPLLAFAAGLFVASLVWVVLVLPAIHRSNYAAEALHKSSFGLLSAVEHLLAAERKTDPQNMQHIQR